MSVDLSVLLRDSRPPRLLLEAELRPVQGVRFQPTGFPDLGAAVFEAPDGTRLLVESAQSMANRLEAVCWDAAENELVAVLRGLSYVRVVDTDGAYLTSSITEAHRLNSPYILESSDKSFFDELREQTQVFEDREIDRRKIAELMFKYDASSLVHGLFLAKKELAQGRLRVERALSAFVEASGVEVAASGGVKNDRLQPDGDTKRGFGNVPFQRDEYTAQRVAAYFSLDLAQIHGYGLGPEADRLLVLLALYKVRALLEHGLRLRTACDLELARPLVVRRPEGWDVPALPDIERALPEAVRACAGRFAGKQGVTQVRFVAKKEA